MRTLKKTLCLVLVLAMMVGLCAIGASAITFDDYKDKDQIKNVEAAKVLTAIGVLQGDDQGTFRPTASLTRAEAASFFTKLCAASGTGTSSFTDMGSAAWAQPYVAYCEQNGIISGYGDGTFGPQNPVTYVQWAKMCLAALGYSAVREGWLNNSAWEVEVIKLVNKINLAAGVEPDWNAPITRDDAAQFAYNTLQATMVEYDGALSVTTGDGTKVEVDVSATNVANNAYDYMNRDYTESKKGTMEFCENYFPTLKMATKVADESFGFKNNVWFKGDTRVDHNLTDAKKIATVQASNTMATYDTGIAKVTGKTLYTDAKASKDTAIELVVNGQSKGIVYAVRLDTTPRLGDYKGSDAFLIDTDKEDSEGYGVADTLIIKQPLLAQVTKVTAATASKDRSVTLKVYAATAKNIEYVTNDFAKGDFILVYPTDLADPTGTNILEAKKAEAAAGTLSAITGSNGSNVTALTVGGVSYSVGTNANLGPNTATVGTGTYALGTGLTAYVSNGFVLGVVTDAVAYGNYVFAIGTNPNGSAFGTPTYNVGSVDQTGATLDALATNIVNTPVTSSQYTPAQIQMHWATKTESGSGYSFTPSPRSFEIASPAISSSNATIGTTVGGVYTVIADSKTVFVVRTSAGFASYTGLANVPNYTAVNSAYALLPDYLGAHAAAIYVDATGKIPTGATTAAIYMYTGQPTGQELDGKITVNKFITISDGEVKTVWATTDHTSFSPVGLVTPTYSGSYLADVAPAPATANHAYVGNDDTKPVSVLGSDLTIGYTGNVYVLAADAVAYYYDGIALKTGTPEEIIDGLVGGYITLVPVSGTDARIKTIYFTNK